MTDVQRRPSFRDDCLAGRRIFVTGASSGIGRAAAVSLSQAGAILVLNGRDEARLAETRAGLSGDGHVLVPGALSSADVAADLVKTAARAHGPFHGLFHAAGSFDVRALAIVKQTHLDQAFDASVFAAYGVGRAASNRKVLSDGGSLVLMSSVAASKGNAGLTAYSGAKAAVLGLVRPLAMELAPRRVRVNAIEASTIITEMHHRTLENADMAHVSRNEARHPLGFGSPDDISDALLFLMSDASLWITGSALSVDGGYGAG